MIHNSELENNRMSFTMWFLVYTVETTLGLLSKSTSPTRFLIYSASFITCRKSNQCYVNVAFVSPTMSKVCTGVEKEAPIMSD